MRITVRLGLLAATLLPLTASAQTPPEQPAVHRVVGQALSSTQAVLLDDATGEYRIVRVGDQVNGASVVAIGESDVVLVRGGTRETLDLAADPRPRPRMTLEPMVVRMHPIAPVAVAASAPVAAPAPVVAPAPAPVAFAAPAPTPVAAPAPTPVAAPAQVPAPVAVAAPVAVPAPVAVAAPVAAPAPAPVAAPVPVAAPAVAPAPTPPSNAPKIVYVEPLIPPPSAPPAAAPVSTPAPMSAPSGVTTVPRAELDRGLGDFAALDASVALEVAPQGGFRVANLQPGCFLEKLGLRRGDVIQRVDGRWLRGVDDASAAYNWVRVTDHFAVDLLRDGRPITLRYQVTA